MNRNHEIYIKNREVFLQTFTERLSSDERFVAAWFTGSFAREEQDTLSDIDITLVIADEHSRILCARHEMVSAQTTKERYDLFCLFGQPALIHENNNNAPEGGTFTFIAYDQNAVMVGWILRPRAGARRPEGARLLFEKVEIPIQSPSEPESQEERASEASERMAFFWMMSAITVKYISRRDEVFVNSWLERLAELVSEVERLTKGQAWQHHSGSRTKLTITPDEQIAAIRYLCKQMDNMKQEVMSLGGYVSESPMSTIESLISVAHEKVGIDRVISHGHNL